MADAVTSHGLHPGLSQYLKKPHIASVRYDEEQQSFVCASGKRPGLVSGLRYRYYPYYRRTTRRKGSRKRARMASSIEQGLAIGEGLTDYLKTGQMPEDGMAAVLVYYFEKIEGHTIQATEVPCFVQLDGSERITRADVITADAKNRLWMWEIKSGYNRVQKQGDLQGLKGVPNRDNTHWELQRHFTHKGLEACGLDIYKSHVLNIFVEDGEYGVQKRPVPRWCKERL